MSILSAWLYRGVVAPSGDKTAPIIAIVENRWTGRRLTCALFYYRDNAHRWLDIAIANRSWLTASEPKDDWNKLHE